MSRPYEESITPKFRTQSVVMPHRVGLFHVPLRDVKAPHSRLEKGRHRAAHGRHAAAAGARRIYTFVSEGILEEMFKLLTVM